MFPLGMAPENDQQQSPDDVGKMVAMTKRDKSPYRAWEARRDELIVDHRARMSSMADMAARYERMRSGSVGETYFQRLCGRDRSERGQSDRMEAEIER